MKWRERIVICVAVTLCGVVWINTSLLVVLSTLSTHIFGRRLFQENMTCFPTASNDSTPEAPKFMPKVYVVTPTYMRLEQKAELTRLSNTLRHVPNLHWILVEDSKTKTSVVRNVLKASKMSYTHLSVETPKELRLKDGDDPYEKPRGRLQRNAGLSWLRNNSRKGVGVVYFADDDNAYDVRLFEEMRYTKKVSVWPVAFVATLKYESPMCKDGKVVGWYTTYARERNFATDMAGFAVNIQLIHNSSWVKFNATPGYLETDFLSDLGVKMTDLEPKAENCTQILVWHTRTEKPGTDQESILQELHGGNLTRNVEI